MLSALARTGLFSLAEHLEGRTAYTVASVTCFAASLLLPYVAGAAGGAALLPAATTALLAKAALGVTYVLSGIPQLAETLGAAAAGRLDTHVLMSLSIVGTLYMGMAQEVRRMRACRACLPACLPACCCGLSSIARCSMSCSMSCAVRAWRLGTRTLPLPDHAASTAACTAACTLALTGRAAAAAVSREPPAGGPAD